MDDAEVDNRAGIERRPRVLVAGTAKVSETLKAWLRIDAEFLLAGTIEEALRCVEMDLSLILCSVRFDESRMFDFLHALKFMPAATGVPVVWCRNSAKPRSASARRVIEVALEVLGVADFLDLAELTARYGAGTAKNVLRVLVMQRLRTRFPPPGPQHAGQPGTKPAK
jgi:hypothetical protein